METTNEVWKDSLIAGEKMLWSGKPQNVKLTDPCAKTSLYITWVIAGIWVILAFALYLPYAITIGITGLQLVVVLIVFCCIPILLFAMPLRDVRTLKNDTFYAVTDHRIMAVNKERRMIMLRQPSLSVKKVPSGDAGTSCVLFGTAAEKTARSWRNMAVMGDDNEAKIIGMMFYQITDDDADRVLSLLNQ